MTRLAGLWWLANVAMAASLGRLLADPEIWALATGGAPTRHTDLALRHAALTGLAMPLALVVLGTFHRLAVRLILIAALGLSTLGGPDSAPLGLMAFALVGIACSRGEDGGDPGRGALIAAGVTLCVLMPANGLTGAEVLGYCAVSATLAFAVGRFCGRLFPEEPERARAWRFDPVGLFVGLALCGTVSYSVEPRYAGPAAVLALLVSIRACMRTADAPAPAQEPAP